MDITANHVRRTISCDPELRGDHVVHLRGEQIGEKSCDTVEQEDLLQAVSWEMQAREKDVAVLSASSVAISEISEMDEKEASLRLEALDATESPKPLFLPVILSNVGDFYAPTDAEVLPSKPESGDMALSVAKRYSTCSSAALSFMTHSSALGPDRVFSKYRRVPNYCPVRETTLAVEERNQNARVKFRKVNQVSFGDHSKEESPMISSPMYAATAPPDASYAYSNMLKNYLSDSARVKPMKDAKMPTFTCPSCHIRHWRPGKCPCCTARPKKPVLLNLPWKSHIKAAGLGSKNVLRGKECYFYEKPETPNSMKKTPEAKGMNFSFIPIDETPSPLSSEDVKLPHIGSENDSRFTWLCKISELLKHSSTKDPPKLPSLVENPPVFSASCCMKERSPWSQHSSAMNVSPYMDARSSGLLKSKNGRKKKAHSITKTIFH